MYRIGRLSSKSAAIRPKPANYITLRSLYITCPAGVGAKVLCYVARVNGYVSRVVGFAPFGAGDVERICPVAEVSVVMWFNLKAEGRRVLLCAREGEILRLVGSANVDAGTSSYAGRKRG